MSNEPKTHAVIPMPVMQAIIAVLQEQPARVSRHILNEIESDTCHEINWVPPVDKEATEN